MNPLLRLVLCLLCAGAHALAQSAALPPGTCFVMSHFKGNSTGGDERLYVSTSPDGANWTALNGGNPVWQPENWQSFYNVVRDPTIIYEAGFFWVAYTSGNYGRHASFGLVKSSDLLNWTFVGEIDTTTPGATTTLTWNPVFFRDGDGSIHVMVSISPTGGAAIAPVPDMHIHELHPLNAAMTQWSTPAPLALPHTNTNECWVWKEGATYHAAYISFHNGAWYRSTSMDLISGWGPAQLVGGGYAPMEGGMVLPRPDGGYRFCVEPGDYEPTGGYRFYDHDAAFSGFPPAQLFTSTVPMRNGKMTAAPATTHYADWQAQHLADLPAAQQLPAADPDGDGRTNLIEYCTALDPRLAADLDAPRGYVTTDTTGDRHLALSYRRLPSLADVGYDVETADGSLAFTSAGAAFAPRSITLLSDGSELVESVDAVPVSGGGARFVRLKLTLQP